MNLHNDDGTLNEAGQKIVDILDSKEFMSDLYEGLDDKTREELGQFYTPAKICIQMIEMFNATDFSGKNVLDPCCGSGNLLIAMLAAGADSDKVYGNDYDYRAVKLCRKRINRACDILGKPHIQDWQIHQGNALHEFALTYFDADYDEMYFDGLKQEAAKKRKLDDEKYDAYTMSKIFKTKYPEIYKLKDKAKDIALYKKQAEENNGFDWSKYIGD
jgi:SAM-dependent methyltransferase